MALNNTGISYLLKLVIPTLEDNNLNYWLGQGVLRDWAENGSIKEEHSDIDLHFWDDDKAMLIKILTELRHQKAQDFNLPYEAESHKITFIKDPKYKGDKQFIVEFMRLFQDEEGTFFKQRKGPNLYVPLECFSGHHKAEIEGVKVAIPNNLPAYLALLPAKKPRSNSGI